MHIFISAHKNVRERWRKPTLSFLVFWFSRFHFASVVSASSIHVSRYRKSNPKRKSSNEVWPIEGSKIAIPDPDPRWHSGSGKGRRVQEVQTHRSASLVEEERLE